MIYVQSLNVNSIGDVVRLLFLDLLKWPPTYYVGHLNDSMRYEFFTLMAKAGFFRRLLMLRGVDENNWRENRDKILAAIDRHWPSDRANGEIVEVWERPDLQERVHGPNVAECEQIRNLLTSVVRQRISGDAYLTIQPASSDHYIKDASDSKLAIETLHDLAGRYGVERVTIIGSSRDGELARPLIERLRRLGFRVSDLCGALSFEDAFAIILGSSGHVGCESWTAMIAAQVLVETRMLIRPKAECVLNSMTKAFGHLPHFKVLEDLEHR